MKGILIILFFIQVLSLSAQKRNSTWMIGGEFPNHNSGINFNSGFPDTFTVYRDLGFFITNAGICDTNGQILFYSNGDYIANRNHGRLLNTTFFNPTITGDTTYGSNGVQTVLILPRPDHPDQYFIFHVNGESFIANNQTEYQPLNLWYSKVDMNLDGGLGGIVTGEKTVTLINDTMTWGRLTACKHANGRDWWVIMHRYYSDLYYKILVTPDTMLVSQQNIGRIVNRDIDGMACFSTDGSIYSMISVDNKLDVLNFDRCTGEFSMKEEITIPVPYAAFGCAFSPSGRYLYANTNTYIFQYDTWANPIASSLDTVAWWDTSYSPLATTFFMQHLAPDNKIYITTAQGTDKLHVINDPDVGGIGCNVFQGQITLPSFNALSLPNSVNYDLGPVTGSACDSLTNEIDEIELSNSISISPNPAKDFYWINYISEIEKDLIFEVYDGMGKIVETKKLYGTFRSLFVDCSNYRSGVYFYKVSIEWMVVKSGKFIVER
jgi:hypothetical protein